jgi:phasin family protein
MTPFSDQLSTVRQAQFEAQLDMFRKLSARALDSAGQIAALNMRASRASMEQAAGTVKQMLEVRDPRELFALGSTAQEQWQAMFSYGRELFGLAVSAPALPKLAPLPAAPAPAPAAAVDIGAAPAEAAIDAGTVARTEDPLRAEAEAAIETAIADQVPPAEPTPLAKAVSELAPKLAGAEHPLASIVALEGEGQVALSAITPTDNVAPPPKVSRGPRRK